MTTIQAKVVKVDNDDEALRFFINDKGLDVLLTKRDGINGLRAVYEALLEEVIEDNVSIELMDKDKDATAMYHDVCREYIQLLNNDLTSARQEVVEKGLAMHVEEQTSQDNV
ncbi:MAG: hypothetical protein ACOYEF_13640 [Planifilum sp.]|jgi:hypothetical protein